MAARTGNTRQLRSDKSRAGCHTERHANWLVLNVLRGWMELLTSKTEVFPSYLEL